ncbi:MAG: SirB2 family protein [Pseudomonadota bacterium]
MPYIAIKHLHITLAALSGGFFLLRGLWMILDSSLLSRRWVKISPHIIDTFLLISAIALVVLSGQYPFVQSWLTAKVIGLIVYISLGIIALKRGKTKTIRVSAFIAALVVFAYIASVAIMKQPLVFLP